MNSIVWHPGEPLSDFVTDVRVAPYCEVAGRRFISADPGSLTWTGETFHRFDPITCVPTRRLRDLVDRLAGTPNNWLDRSSSFAAIRWEPRPEFPDGATLLLLRVGGELRGIVEVFVCLEGRYTGLRPGEVARIDGHLETSGEVVGWCPAAPRYTVSDSTSQYRVRVFDSRGQSLTVVDRPSAAVKRYVPPPVHPCA